MDACSTTDHRLGKDSPSNKLLFAKDIPQYREMVTKFYSDVASISQITDQELSTSMQQLSAQQIGYFHTISALKELYIYVTKYNDQICCRNIQIEWEDDYNTSIYSITQGLLASCIWSYPCNENPCKAEATCVPRGISSFMCLCSDDDCSRKDYQHPYTIYSKTLQLELLELTPVTLFEGQNILITPSHINVVLDYAKYGIRDSGVLFTTVPSQLPKHGRLAVEVWEKSGTLQTFTLLDLIRDKVRYVHDGSESSSDSMSFDLELSPGSNFVLPGYLQGQHRFKIHVNITAVNDPPSLVITSSKTLHLAVSHKIRFPLVRILTKTSVLPISSMLDSGTMLMNGAKETSISTETISYQTTPIGLQANDIVFTLKQLPRFGSLYEENGRRLILHDNFTQESVNFDRIRYRMLRTAYVKLTDSFESEVSAPHCSEKPLHTVNIVYQPPENLPLRVLSNMKTIKGDLEKEKVVIVEKSLTLNPLILSVSDGTHSTDFQFDVRPSPPYVELMNNSHLVVAQGSQAVITTSNLYSDTNINVRLQDIRYIVTSVPSHGELLVNGDSNKLEFEQGNLENGSVFYKHLSSSLAQDRLQLKIGVHDTYTTGSLAIRVFPPIYWEPLIIASNSTVYVEEYTSVVIKSDNIMVKIRVIPSKFFLPNVDLVVNEGGAVKLPDHLYVSTTTYFTDKIVDYHVHQQPLYGSILMFPNNRQVSKWTVSQLKNHAIKVLAVNILDDTATVHYIWVDVMVLPLVTMADFSVISGTRSKLDLSVLDASALAKMCNTNPVFRILKKPRYGTLKKIIRSSGEFKKTREKEVSKFTHEELKSGLIYFFSKKNIDSIDDQFLFELYADTCQPAAGRFPLRIVSEVSGTTMRPQKTQNSGSKDDAVRDDVQIASPNMSDDYLLGVSLVTGVVALALLIVAFIKCGSKHSSYDDSIKSDLPDPLPRPPDDLLPSSPHIAISSAQILSPHIGGNVANNGSANSSEHELNLRYPYGEEDWNSYGATDSVVPTKVEGIYLAEPSDPSRKTFHPRMPLLSIDREKAKSLPNLSFCVLSRMDYTDSDLDPITFS
ncbi:unnamed protein product [Nesidiocoris tenuis]|uniref:Plexin cytoplasmic RasGAP domain-containing protein n=1 Tax=Nesidiocoris tenuis TaxID=355587 RepID=A0A6H5HA69_9HEMI|nr:unnamed protein product [Nesidiocoris tenuis]